MQVEMSDFKIVMSCTATNNMQIQGSGTATFLPPEQLSTKYDGRGEVSYELLILMKCKCGQAYYHI